MATVYNPIDIENNEAIFSCREKILNEAFEQLGERGTNLIVWRKLEKLSNEAIAERLGLAPGSVTNEVYDAFVRLKKIVNRIQKLKPCI